MGRQPRLGNTPALPLPGDPGVRRKALFDRVQAIVVDQAPVLYLVDKDSLSAVSGALGNVSPAVLHPQTLWNVERLYFRDAKGSGH